jgi:hypothetical protein
MKSFLTFISEADGNPSPNKAGNSVSKPPKPEVKKSVDKPKSTLLNPDKSSQTASARVARTRNLTEDPLLEYEDFIKTLEKMAQTGGELNFRDGVTARVPSEYIRKAIAIYNQLGSRGERLALSRKLNNSPGDFKSAVGFTQ